MGPMSSWTCFRCGILRLCRTCHLGSFGVPFPPLHSLLLRNPTPFVIYCADVMGILLRCSPRAASCPSRRHRSVWSPHSALAAVCRILCCSPFPANSLSALVMVVPPSCWLSASVAHTMRFPTSSWCKQRSTAQWQGCLLSNDGQLRSICPQLIAVSFCVGFCMRLGRCLDIPAHVQNRCLRPLWHHLHDLWSLSPALQYVLPSLKQRSSCPNHCCIFMAIP